MNTDISVIIDMSGSMQSIADDTVGGFNAWLKETAKGQQADDDVNISVTVFDTAVEKNVKVVALKDCPELGTPENPYGPRGMTALLDAVGDTLTSAKARVKKGDRGLAVIITDGHENASQRWDHAKLGALMAKLEKSKRWSFVYLGAGIDAWSQAQTYNQFAVQTQAASFSRGQTLAASAALGTVTSQYLASNNTNSATLGAQTTRAMQPKAKVKSS